MVKYDPDIAYSAKTQQIGSAANFMRVTSIHRRETSEKLCRHERNSEHPQNFVAVPEAWIRDLKSSFFDWPSMERAGSNVLNGKLETQLCGSHPLQPCSCPGQAAAREGQRICSAWLGTVAGIASIIGFASPTWGSQARPRACFWADENPGAYSQDLV